MANRRLETNSVLFHLSVWPSSAVPSQRSADGVTTDRRILFFLTESVWPSSVLFGLCFGLSIADTDNTIIIAFNVNVAHHFHQEIRVVVIGGGSGGEPRSSRLCKFIFLLLLLGKENQEAPSCNFTSQVEIEIVVVYLEEQPPYYYYYYYYYYYGDCSTSASCQQQSNYSS